MSRNGTVAKDWRDWLVMHDAPKNRLSLEMLTLFGMPPVEHVKLAADLGCAGISLGLSGRSLAQFGYADFNPYPDWSLSDDLPLRREVKAALCDTGLAVSLGEGFRVLPGQDIADQAGALDIMAELGAQHINGGTMDPDMDRSFDQLALLAELTSVRGMGLSLEFSPSNAINTLAKAVAAVEHVGVGRCDLLIDAMHFFRCGAGVQDLAGLDPALIGYAQLCDVPLLADGDNYMREAMFKRRVPGEGELPLRAWLSALPENIWIGLEVPTIDDLRSGLGPRDHAARVVAAARDLGV